MMDKAARAALLTAKGMDKTSENIADYVADLLRQGRASEITDDLMAQADPQRLHHHYTTGNTGQPMPMDQASRMERAAQMGFGDQVKYHGTPHLDLDRLKPSAFGAVGPGVYLTQNPKTATDYARGYGQLNPTDTFTQDNERHTVGGNITPVLTKGNLQSFNDWTNKKGEHMKAQGLYGSGYKADEAASQDAIGAGYTGVQARAQNSVEFDPTNIRSQFARFDPRLSHLSHLSASTGGVMEFARHVEAVNRAGGQIAPSKYLPNVPRAVHADGGKVAFQQGNHPDVPDVMYHGTGAEKDFSSFSMPGNKTGRKTGGNAIYLSTSPDVAGTFANYGAKPRIMPLHVSAKNPFDFRNTDHIDALQGALTKNFKSWFPGAMYGPQTAMNWMRGGDFGLLENSNVRSWMKRKGHDSYFVTEGEGKPLNLAVFDPKQVKSAIGNSGNFDPTDPDITKADGGPVMFQGIHPELQGESGAPLDLYHGTTQSKEFEAFDNAKLGARDAGFYGRGHYLTPLRGNAEGYADPDEMGRGAVIGPLHAALKNPYVWDVSSDEKSNSTLRDLQSMGIMREKNELNPWDNLQQHHIQPFMAEMQKRGHDGVVVKTGHEHLPNGISEVVAFDPKTIKHTEAEMFDPNDPRIRRDDGGRAGYADGGKSLGLYSKAAQIIRNQPQAKGNVDQLLAMVSKGKGVKPTELANAGRPAGDTMTKEELAQHFEQALPDVQVTRKGRVARNAVNALMQQDRRNWGQEDWDRANALHQEAERQPSTRYDRFTLPGGQNYREHLLHLPEGQGPLAKRRKELQDQWQQAYENDAPKEELDRLGAEFDELANDEGEDFKSSHWKTPNVLAHVRMDERDNGKTLHVQEVQSDWGQEGREKGFYDPANPYEVVRNNGTDKEVVSRHPDWTSMVEAHRAYRGLDDVNYGDVRDEKVPHGPYVGNTQQWTDLALKHVLMEAAKGGHDRVVFSPGEANADMYGQRKKANKVSYNPDTYELTGYNEEEGSPFNRYTFSRYVENPEDLHKHVGRDIAEQIAEGGSADVPGGQVGGQGMIDYYKNYVHPGALKLLQQHDPSIKPESYDLPNDYKGFSLPMTDTARQSILKNGFQAFKNGGIVGYADGGMPEQNGEMNVGTEAGTAPLDPATRTQAGELPQSGGIRGSGGVLQAPHEAPLAGLPSKITLTTTGQVIDAGPDPRIRQVARDYMAKAGLPYNPPTNYAKVDPKRAARIASAYTDMKDDPSDPLTKASYDAMIKETMAQYQAAKAAGFKAEFWNPNKEEDPYKASPRLATEDVRNNHHMWVYPTYAGYGSGDPISDEDVKKNPLLQLTGETWNGIPVTVNDVFRAIHDYYGHAKEGVGFRGDGEENAWRAHASMFSPLARMAMTSETRGQNSWVNYGPHGEHNRTARTEDTIFAPQKIGVLPHWLHHEGTEDFMKPEDAKAMELIQKHYGRSSGGAVDAALSLTRRFTKNGNGVTMSLKPRGK